MTRAGTAWQMMEPLGPLKLTDMPPTEPGQGEVLLRIDGCGVCHTDLGFLYGGVRTRKPLPLTLGHEIVGTVEKVGPGARLELGGAAPGAAKAAPGAALAPQTPTPGLHVVVPAVLPCGDCPLCRAGRDNMCLAQKMPGNDFDGGFATHIVAPARYLIPVTQVPPGHDLIHLAVVADAVTTPYQALLRAKVAKGDHVIVIGAGGVGIFGVQIAAALQAQVIAVDIDDARLEAAAKHGAAKTINTRGLDDDAARKAVQAAAKEHGFPRHGVKVFEMSGTAPGQRLAFSLLSPTGTLGVVGFTRDKVEVRLSNLMAFDADAFGSWGCSPRRYPAVLDLITQGKIQVKPFVTPYPLSEINAVLDEARHGRLTTRPVMVPDK
jgi:6-hydroxycyclohex-1-ene-1-carbonyl-CoA dehydrogenase